MSEIRLLLATDDRDLLVSLLIFLREEADMHVVGTAVDAQSILILMQSTHADIALVDETLLGKGAHEIVDRLQCIEPRPRLVVLAAQENVRSGTAAVDGVVFKHASPAHLIDSLRKAIA